MPTKAPVPPPRGDQTLRVYLKYGMNTASSIVSYETYERLLACWSFRRSIFGIFATNVFTLYAKDSIIDIDLDSIVAVRYGGE